MSEIILYQGKSGCGKSTSLRNLDPKKTAIISPNGKALPFPNGDQYEIGVNRIITDELDLIPQVIGTFNAQAGINTIVIEDFSHYFTARILSKKFLSQNTGDQAFQRWNNFGASVFQSCFSKAQEWRDDLLILIIHHVEVKEDGGIGFKSSGKLLEKVVDPVGYCNYVFHGVVETDKAGNTRYMMQTNRDAIREAKTVAGAFPDFRIYNDMNLALERIRDYKKGKIVATFIE